ncbi:P-loop containing nucleoside triphosphate hydrolase protein [Dunaliella salina]|nr:P-loop containing nucleoside triphosphate hydrolase protein [Dunaliella salina]|eukprot:KAF5827343.1 P-loop containing nucleoside triphosphate hydrolase protein [Dunaliella salina]
MGHVDHGKTSLLDYIRKSRVAAREAGGITQGIGAYNTTVEVDGEQRMVCFLDTPGHEAFSAMRARGAQVTDIAVIIVAADDGIRPQTREAVAHAQAAEVPIIVAINKIDKPGADPERVKTELLELNLVPEEWGGNTPMVLVSAKKGEGIADLLQIISWTAEEKALVCNPLNRAQGTVIEAHLDRKVGPVATLLVQAGTVKHGDIINAGGAYGKIRVLKDDLGNNLESAGASIPVQVIGLNLTPMAGEEWSAAANETEAREAAEVVQEKVRMQRMAEMTGGGSMVTLSSLATVDEDSEAMQKLNLIIKGDSMGMVEAIKASLSTLPQEAISLRYLLSGSGDITLSDIDLAAASGGLVLGFNLEPNDIVETHAKRLGVRVMTYKAEVKAVFGSSKSKVAGCVVTQGKLQKQFITVRRGKQVVFDGKMASLRRIKDDVEEVAEGVECGLGAEGFTDWKEGDKIECYTMVSKSRRLEEAQATKAVDLSTLEV